MAADDATTTTGSSLSERRRSSAAHVRALLDNALDAVVALDAEGRVNFWNPQAEQTFGLSREAAIGRELADLAIAEDDRPLFREAIRAACENRLTKEPRIELRGRRDDGRPFPLELTLTPIPDSLFCVSVFARDITER